MAAIRNFNNNKENNNNNDNNDDNRPYSYNNNNTPHDKTKYYYVIILAIGAVAAIITISIFYQQMQIDAEATEFINNSLTTWKMTNGETGYNVIQSIVTTSDFKGKIKQAIQDSDSEIDKQSNLMGVLADIIPEYMQRSAMMDPSLSNLERGLMIAFANNMRGSGND